MRPNVGVLAPVRPSASVLRNTGIHEHTLFAHAYGFTYILNTRRWLSPHWHHSTSNQCVTDRLREHPNLYHANKALPPEH